MRAIRIGVVALSERHDVDHIVDFQLGGADDVSNMSPLPSSANRSLGAQIAHQIKDYPEGTVFGEFSIKERNF